MKESFYGELIKLGVVKMKFEVNSIYKIGQKVKIISGRFQGFQGVVSNFFNARNSETGKVESGVRVKKGKDYKEAFNTRIESI